VLRRPGVWSATPRKEGRFRRADRLRRHRRRHGLGQPRRAPFRVADGGDV